MSPGITPRTAVSQNRRSASLIENLRGLESSITVTVSIKFEEFVASDGKDLNIDPRRDTVRIGAVRKQQFIQPYVQASFDQKQADGTIRVASVDPNYVWKDLLRDSFFPTRPKPMVTFRSQRS